MQQLVVDSGNEQFFFWKQSDSEDLYVESGGVTAKIVDIRIASNGVIISIDNVLGRADTSIKDKLENMIYTR